MDGDVEYDPGWSTTHLILNTVCSALFAGVVAVLVTVVIEKWGGTLGGIMGTMPGTIVPMTVGVAVQADTDYTKLRNSLYVVPLGMTAAVFFLFLWRLVPPYLPKWEFRWRLTAMVSISLFGWLCWSTALYIGLNAFQNAGFTIPQLGVTGAIALFLAGLAGACYRPMPSPKGANKVTPVVYFARSVIAATSIGGAVLLSKWSDVLAGIFACFPAIFLTAMCSLWISQGEAMPTGAVGPMMLGSGAVYVYSILFAEIFPFFNDRWMLGLAVVATTATAWLISVLVMSVPIYFGLKWRNSASSGHDQVEEDSPYEDEEEIGLKSVRSYSDSVYTANTPQYGSIKQ